MGPVLGQVVGQCPEAELSPLGHAEVIEYRHAALRRPEAVAEQERVAWHVAPLPEEPQVDHDPGERDQVSSP